MKEYIKKSKVIWSPTNQSDPCLHADMSILPDKFVWIYVYMHLYEY